MFDLKNCIMKIISNSPSRHLVRLQGKLKPTEKEKVSKEYLNITEFFYFIFQNSNELVLRHGVTSRKVAGSIPDCVIGIIH